MGSDKGKRAWRDLDQETDEESNSTRRKKVDPDERDEYEEWRQERSKRGRKRKGKAGGRHRRRDDEDF